jgi:8-amino-7-oxononanoate synthase
LRFEAEVRRSSSTTITTEYRGTMYSIDELQRRFSQVFSPNSRAESLVAPSGAGKEPLFYSRLRGTPNVDAYRTSEDLEVSPFFIANESLDGPVARIGGRETLMFGSNNYLGLTRHPEVMQAARDALERYGTSCTGSRLLNGTIAPHVEFEEEIADFLGYQKALMFTTGFMANQGAISSLCRRGDQVFSDKDNHASIVDGLNGSGVQYFFYGHNDPADLNLKLSKLPIGPPRLIIADSVFSMSGDVVKLPELMRVARQHGALVYLDEAHGIGTLGATGRGAADHFHLADKPDLVMGTLSKSLASIGGFIAGPAVVIDYLRMCARPFVFSAACAPAMAAAGLTALRVLRREPERVEAARANARYLAEGLRHIGYTCSSGVVPIISVRCDDAVQGCSMHRALVQAGVLTNMVLFPAIPPGEAMLRVSVMATHSREHLDRGLEVFESIGRKFQIGGPRGELRRLLRAKVALAATGG